MQLKKKEYNKRYYQKNREQILKYKKEYSKLNSDKIKSTNLKTKYGITLEEYNELFSLQRGKCAICNIHQSDLGRPLFIDHCHLTGKIRGLLCQHCNCLLGYSGDNVEVLKNSIKYLENDIIVEMTKR